MCRLTFASGCGEAASAHFCVRRTNSAVCMVRWMETIKARKFPSVLYHMPFSKPLELIQLPYSQRRVEHQRSSVTSKTTMSAMTSAQRLAWWPNGMAPLILSARARAMARVRARVVSHYRCTCWNDADDATACRWHRTIKTRTISFYGSINFICIEI